MAFNTIRVKVYHPHHEEYLAQAAITPGMLVELKVNTSKVQAHGTASKNVPVIMFAMEDELQGREIGDAYKANEWVQVLLPRSGDFVYAIIGQNNTIQKGDILVSKGDGTLAKAAAASGTADKQGDVMNIVGIALEGVTVANTSGATGRCLIQVR